MYCKRKRAGKRMYSSFRAKLLLFSPRKRSISRRRMEEAYFKLRKQIDLSCAVTIRLSLGSQEDNKKE